MEQNKDEPELKFRQLVKPEDVKEAIARLEAIQANLEKYIKKLDEAREISPELWKTMITV